jgi:hypothetical protein
MYYLASMTQFKGAPLLNFHAAFAGWVFWLTRNFHPLSSCFLSLFVDCKLNASKKIANRLMNVGGMPYALSDLINWEN